MKVKPPNRIDCHNQARHALFVLTGERITYEDFKLMEAQIESRNAALVWFDPAVAHYRVRWNRKVYTVKWHREARAINGFLENEKVLAATAGTVPPSSP